MSFWTHPAAFATLLTLTIFPLFWFRLIPFESILTPKMRLRLWISEIALLLLNGIIIGCLYASPQALVSSTAIQIFKSDVCIYYLLSLIPFLLVLRKYLLENLFVFGTMGLFALLILSIGLFIVNQTSFSGLLKFDLLCVILLGVCVVLSPLIVGTLTKTVTPFLGKNTENYWHTIWIVPNAMLIAGVCAVPMNAFLSTPAQLVSRLLIGIATVFICRTIAYDYVLYSRRTALELQMEAQKEYYQALTAKMHNDRRARHDFQHQLAAICAMADRRETEELQDYCHRLLHHAKGDAIPHTGNAAIDSVLYRYTLRAAEEHIPFDVCGHFKPHSKAEIDLCVALGNALENAMTATAVLPVENRFVEAEVLLENTLLSLTVKNSFDGVLLQDNDGYLSRKRRNEHGYGLDSIRYVCESYGGTMTIHHDDSTFTVMMLMNIDD